MPSTFTFHSPHLKKYPLLFLPSDLRVTIDWKQEKLVISYTKEMSVQDLSRARILEKLGMARERCALQAVDRVGSTSPLLDLIDLSEKRRITFVTES